MQSIQIGLQIVLMFFVLVSLHEWGHYYFAKRAGILVREFAIGFGPKIFSYTKGETRYTLRLLPIGGFVRMAGEDPEIVIIQPGQRVALQIKDNQVTHLFTDQLDQRSLAIQGTVEQIDLEKQLFVMLSIEGDTERFDVHPQAIMVTKGRETQIAPLDRQFGSKTVSQRALSIFAGPLMNFLLAFVLFVLFVALSGVASNVKLDTVNADSPAAKAGLLAGDIIKEVNHIPINADREKFIDLIQKSKDQPMNWIIIRGQEEKQTEVTPALDNGSPKVGVVVGFDSRNASFKEVVTSSWDTMVYWTKSIVSGLKKLVLGQFKMDELSGPVGTIQITSQIAHEGIKPMILWSGILSLYLGLFNLLPFPALDGSRLVFLGIEAVRGKPVDPSRESVVHFIGFAMLMLLMIVVTYNDILRLING
ncbi:RIP metalloprotease RseP [Paenibacillus psychroresistens]|uniref:Zinc metalloprotease n=1 Tax=Paenibacillus psychroresistens TaxID=1778678 RepID=A0A6B8RL74_9BACL|nr:RIP metalloprotease RseP [Paenibacillus psychroresistens]QGQ96265.1 RIP metalloprotease RseP [Paenibacillus psychroresistens]